MKKLFIYLSFLSIAALLGCENETDVLISEMAEYENVEYSLKQETEETPVEIQRKLVKEGRIEFETEDLAATRKSIFEAVKKYKGYVSSDQEYKSEDRFSNSISIRIPADDFDLFLNAATQGVNRFDSKDITTRDVTEEYVDAQARIKTKKELEQRYIQILEKAQNVPEILEIERQIGELRSQIESIEGRLKYLKNKVAYSTISITIYERTVEGSQFGKEFKNGFQNGWENLIWFFVILTNLWPFIFLVIIAIVLVKFLRNRRKKTS